jgi:uncharacterized spore protein YtfJ
MAIHQFLESLSDKLQISANVNKIYGNPIEVQGKVIIPVAKIAYGLGGGYGKAKTQDKEGNREEKPAGQSGGGGIRAVPLGIIEISGENTRFIPFGMKKTISALILIFTFILGVVCGRLLL